MTRTRAIRHWVAAAGLMLVGGPSAASAGPDKPETTRLAISISGFRNAKGQAGISVFRSKEGFPSDYHKAAVGKALPIRDGRVRWTIERLPRGRYAILVLHDENANGKMDTNLLGIPTEGYGVSNDARRPFGPPLFDQAAIQVKGSQQEVRIQVKY